MPRGEGIKPINQLFEKYKQRLVAPQGSVKKCFCEVVEDLYGFSIKAEQLDYSTYSKTLTLKVPGALKTELMLHKSEIMAHLKGRLGAQNAPKTLI